MGSICDSCNCNIFPTPDDRESSCDMDDKVPLVMNPDLSYNSNMNDTCIDPLPDDIGASDDHDNNISLLSYPEPRTKPITNNSVAERRGLFETDSIKHNTTNIKKKKAKHGISIAKPVKQNMAKRRAMFETHLDTKAITKPTRTKANKPKKKWIVKGIDDKDRIAQIKPPIAINASSYIRDTDEDSSDREMSVSLSHSDRMKMYEEDLVNVQQKHVHSRR
eukprot:118745_1